MNRLVRVLSVLTEVMMLLAFIIQQGCGKEQAHPEKPPISWNSSRMLDIQKEWDALLSKRTQSKSDYGKLAKKLEDVLENNLTDRDVRHLAASCDSLPVHYQDRSDFDNAVLMLIVRRLMALGDRENLLQVLSTRFTNRVYPYVCIEYFLVSNDEKIKYPILVLGEAYKKCRDDEMRHNIAVAVRRAFTDQGVQGKDDAKFVENAMQWYETQKGKLAVNRKYPDNAAVCPDEAYDLHPQFVENFPGGKREPLFIKKP